MQSSRASSKKTRVYRIDHYLGKETVQNIMMFRFGNSMFEPIWNRNYIDYIEITAAETLGVENRAAFYEETGALRDMVANHLLQLADADRDGAAGGVRCRLRARAEGAGAARDSPDVGGGSGQAHNSRTVRAGQNQRSGCSRISPGAGRKSRLANRDLRGRRVPRGQLALGGSSLLRARRQATGKPGHGNCHPLQAHAAGAVRAGTRKTSTTTSSRCGSSPTKAFR